MIRYDEYDDLITTYEGRIPPFKVEANVEIPTYIWQLISIVALNVQNYSDRLSSNIDM